MTLVWLGRISIYLAFFAALGGIGAQVLTLRRGTPSRALLWSVVSLVGVASAFVVMEFAFVTHNFSLAYVAENNATFTPLLYSLTGVWSALEGSILLWSLVLGGLLSAVVVRYRREASDPVVVWATLVMLSLIHI